MGNLNRDALIAELEADARLATLKIQRTPLQEIHKLDMARMTAGELITVAEAYRAISVLSNILQGKDATGNPMPKVERRTRPSSPWDDMTVETVNGPMKYGDVPRDEDGDVDHEWLEANCVCDEHEEKRIAADKSIGDDSIARGLYL